MEEFSSPAAGEREGNAPRCVFEFHNRFLNKSSSPKARCWVGEMTDLILDTPLPEEEQSWLPMDLGWTRRPRGGHIDGVEDRPLLRGSRQKLRQRVGVSIVSLNVVKKKKKQRQEGGNTGAENGHDRGFEGRGGERWRERRGAVLMWDADQVGEFSPARDACWVGEG